MLYDHRMGAALTVGGIGASQAPVRPSFSLVLTGGASCSAFFAKKPDAFETVVVDSASDHSGLELIEALRRCRGELIAISYNTTFFTEDAFVAAAAAFRANPNAGGVCFEGFLTDQTGQALADVSIVTLLLTSAKLCLTAGFLRRSALLSVGLERDDWTPGSVGLDLWCRIATDFDIVNLPRCAPDFTVSVSSSDMSTSAAAIENRLALVARHFSREGFFEGKAPELELEGKLCQVFALSNELAPIADSTVDRLLVGKALSLLEELHTLLQVNHRALHSISRLIASRMSGRIIRYALLPLLRWIGQCSRPLAIHAGYALWNAPYRGFPFLGRWLLRALILPRRLWAAPSGSPSLKDAYALAGIQYEARGQIEAALAMWDRGRPPNDAAYDSLACQAALKSPTATDESLARLQRVWVERYIGRKSQVVLPRLPSRSKIRIGYHCAFMASDTMRHMMRNVLLAHDRDRFEVYGYSPQPVPVDIMASFDVVRLTPSIPTSIDPGIGGVESCSDEQFVRLVRNDVIDVFVELTGFSPGHRFVAMAQRCAPIQASFLNHAGTTQVPNVDYVLSDSISTPANLSAQHHYSERIYRLPGCFFSFDYSDSNGPDIVDPPSLHKGWVTFGCFGSGGKINLAMIELWAALLHAVPNAVLHLRNMQLNTVDNRRFMADRFERFGISPTRLILGHGVAQGELWNFYSEIDISLDTWPYCGGNSIAESLWHGVPVITMNGHRFSASYGSSLISAAGCRDLIADTSRQYIQIATELANDPLRLRHLRQQLRKMSLDHGLGDSKLFALKLEQAFCIMLDGLNSNASNTSNS